MTPAIKKILQDHADGMGVSLTKVRKHYESLPETQRFAFLRGCRELETQHREYVKGPKKFRKEATPALYGPDGEEIT